MVFVQHGRCWRFPLEKWKNLFVYSRSLEFQPVVCSFWWYLVPSAPPACLIFLRSWNFGVHGLAEIQQGNQGRSAFPNICLGLGAAVLQWNPAPLTRSWGQRHMYWLCTHRDCVQRLISMKYECIHEALLIYNALTEYFFSLWIGWKRNSEVELKSESVLNCKKKWGLFVFKQIEIYIPGIKPLLYE